MDVRRRGALYGAELPVLRGDDVFVPAPKTRYQRSKPVDTDAGVAGIKFRKSHLAERRSERGVLCQLASWQARCYDCKIDDVAGGAVRSGVCRNDRTADDLACSSDDRWKCESMDYFDECIASDWNEWGSQLICLCGQKSITDSSVR